MKAREKFKARLQDISTRAYGVSLAIAERKGKPWTLTQKRNFLQDEDGNIANAMVEFDRTLAFLGYEDVDYRRDAGICGRCGSGPGSRDLTCPDCTDPDGNDILTPGA